ncbi:TraH family protein [Rhizobium calliandrae]|uniref:TraH family protein n=1 Tax=Rhizobium calliandrae TaxID=1312182 RepID=A0ABT7KG29_9HYPH|nr:TraH family protein [Rhizobium calliandrae]MDL2406144.1 TraH family protein [Rhizobium calliandrae]
MLDTNLIKRCANPTLTPPIVEQFVAAVGSDDPLAVTVKQGGRLILLPKSRTSDEALQTSRQYVASAIVRIGVTQYPAGIGVKDPSQLHGELFDACENLRIGTTMFAKIVRIVSKWYGNPKDKNALPQILDDAFDAWKTGYFDGRSVFDAPDPGRTQSGPGPVDPDEGEAPSEEPPTGGPSSASKIELENAGIRIDLSRIDGRN